MKQEDKAKAIATYGARAVEIRHRLPWGPEVQELGDVESPMVGDEVYVDSHNGYRRGVVVHVARIRATVLLTTDGAVKEALSRSDPKDWMSHVHFTFATKPIAELGKGRS